MEDKINERKKNLSVCQNYKKYIKDDSKLRMGKYSNRNLSQEIVTKRQFSNSIIANEYSKKNQNKNLSTILPNPLFKSIKTQRKIKKPSIKKSSDDIIPKIIDLKKKCSNKKYFLANKSQINKKQKKINKNKSCDSILFTKKNSNDGNSSKNVTKSTSFYNSQSLINKMSFRNNRYNKYQRLNVSSIPQSKTLMSLNKNNNLNSPSKTKDNYHITSRNFSNGNNILNSRNVNIDFSKSNFFRFVKSNEINKCNSDVNINKSNSPFKLKTEIENKIFFNNSSIREHLYKNNRIISAYKNENNYKKNQEEFNKNNDNELQLKFIEKLKEQLKIKNQNKLINYKEILYEFKNNNGYLTKIRNYNNNLKLRQENENKDKKTNKNKKKKFKFYKYKEYMSAIEKENMQNFIKEKEKKQDFLVEKIFGALKVKKSTTKNNQNKTIKSTSDDNINNDKEMKSGNSENTENILDKNDLTKTNNVKFFGVIDDNIFSFHNRNKQRILRKKSSKRLRKNKNYYKSIYTVSRTDDDISLHSANIDVSINNLSLSSVSTISNKSFTKGRMKVVNNISLDKKEVNLKLLPKCNKQYQQFRNLRSTKEKSTIRSIASQQSLIAKIKEYESEQQKKRKSLQKFLKNPFIYLNRLYRDKNKKENKSYLKKFIKRSQMNSKYELILRKKISNTESDNFTSFNNSVYSYNDYNINFDDDDDEDEEVYENNCIIEEDEKINNDEKINLDEKDNFMIQYCNKFFPEKEDDGIENEEKIKEACAMFTNLIHNSKKLIEEIPPSERELFLGFKEKIDSLKKMGQMEYEKFIYENYKYFKKELEECKKGQYQERFINNFINKLNNQIDLRDKIESSQNIKIIYS